MSMWCLPPKENVGATRVPTGSVTAIAAPADPKAQIEARAAKATSAAVESPDDANGLSARAEETPPVPAPGVPAAVLDVVDRILEGQRVRDAPEPESRAGETTRGASPHRPPTETQRWRHFSLSSCLLQNSCCGAEFPRFVKQSKNRMLEPAQTVDPRSPPSRCWPWPKNFCR
jgi:hypothetical protein